MRTKSREVLLALVLFAMPGASACAATSSSPRAPEAETARADLGSEAMVAYWECVSRELEVGTQEVAINVTGPRGALHVRPTRCTSPLAPHTLTKDRPAAALPTPDNAGLGTLSVAALVDRAGALDADMRLSLDERGTVRVHSMGLKRLRATLHATPKHARSQHAAELRRRIDVASELALRLSPLGRTFARAHGETQLIHAYAASLVAERGGAIEADTLRRVLGSARRIERAAATSTALLAVVQAGLEGTVPGHTLLDTARAARDTLYTPIRLTDEELAADWCPRSPSVRLLDEPVHAFLRDPGAPDALPSLGDISDASTATAGDDFALRGWAHDSEMVPFLLANAYPETAAPRRSAQSVRAILDNDSKIALHHARALVGPSQLDLVLSIVEGSLLLAQLD